MATERTRRLGELIGALSGAVRRPGIPEGARVTGVSADSRAVEPGRIFVAVRGAVQDGHDFIGHAVARGAGIVVAEREPSQPVAVPVIRVADARAALAELAAAWYGHPARRLGLVGITGSLGKTSVLSMLEAILRADGVRVGTVGSLGVRLEATVEPIDLTTPDPLTLHRALARFAARGTDVAVMEVTSHALAQRRVHGLDFGLGIFTNLALLEHLEYHGSFRAYVAAKTRFFDHLSDGAPLIHPAADRAVRSLARGRRVSRVSCGPRGIVSVRTERLRLDRAGTRIVLRSRRAFRRADGGSVPPVEMPIELRVLGRPNVMNAALAAAAALGLGAAPAAVQRALAAFPAPWRRMQIVHRGRLTVLDDTVGHPDSISAVFDVARRIPHRRLHVVYAIRGRRGPAINRWDSETLGVWARRVGLAVLVVTASEEAVDERNRVRPSERDAFLSALRRHGVEWDYRERLDAAIGAAHASVRDGDLLLLLGAQGMNRGAELIRERLA